MTYSLTSDGIETMLPPHSSQSSDPDLYAPYVAFIHRLMRHPVGPSRREKEIIAAFCTLLDGCEVCFRTHRDECEALGVDPAMFEKLAQDIHTAPVDDRLKPVLRYVRKLTLTPGRTADEDAKACYRAGWSERDLAIALTVCTSWNWFNRMILGHQPEREHTEGFFAPALPGDGVERAGTTYMA